MGKEKLNKKALVVKSNEINEAHYRLSLNEQKVILAMVSQIKPDDEDFKSYVITIPEFIDLLGVQDSDKYSVIGKIARDLRHKDLRIYKPETDSYLDTGWLSSSEYYHGKGYVELCFDPKLKPYLLGLKRKFTAYQLQNIIQLKSTYSIRIYELLKQYQKLGNREFKIIELKQILGIKAKEYPFYANFKDRVILPSQAELSEKTDISFEFTEKKTGRAVTAIKFHIFVKTSTGDTIDADYAERDEYDEAISKMSVYEQELFKRLQKDFRLSKKQSHIVITVYLLRKGKDYVEAILAYVQGYHRKALKVDASAHVGAITWAAFKDGWVVGQDDQTGPKTTSKQAKSKPKEIIPEPTEEERKEIKKMLDDFKRKSYRDA
ncbi:MAG: replication initiation protein [Nitrospirae bacterium]|nr:replication initiation protein [Nitrospirota bacterium]